MFSGGEEIQVRYLITLSDDRSGGQMIKKMIRTEITSFIYIYYLLPTRVTIIVPINELCTRCTC